MSDSFNPQNFSQQIHELSQLNQISDLTKFVVSKTVPGNDLFSSKSLSAIELKTTTVKNIESLSSFSPTGNWTFDSGLNLPEKTLNNALRSGLSTTIVNCSILEKDFYTLLNKLSNDIYKNHHIPSAPGEIIFSTKLKSEAAVKKIYGDYTSWKQIPGRFLLATTVTGRPGPASSTVFQTLRNPGVRGGETKHLPTIEEVPTHTHTFTAADNVKTLTVNAEPEMPEIPSGYKFLIHKSSTKSAQKAGEPYFASGTATNLAVEMSCDPENGVSIYGNSGPDVIIKENSSRNKAHNNMPPFYSVYIWKRIK